MTGIACFHCLRVGHWQHNCPLLQMPDDRDHHEARIATITHWFTDGLIGPAAKARMITKENALWKERTKEMARK